MVTVTGVSVEEAANWLRKGFAVGIPTETVYGLAANALDEAAVLKIFTIKNRPSFDPLIVHVSGPDAVNEIAYVPVTARKLMEQFWPGPLTILLEKKKVIPDLVTSGLPTVGVRMPAHPLTLELLKNLPFPLAAPSANPFGYISPTTPIHVQDQLKGKIPYILDGGPSSVGVESTIVSPEDDHLVLHRLGGIPVEALEKAGFIVRAAGKESKAPVAPGNLDSHYAPAKPLYFGKASTLFSKQWEVPVELICLNRENLEIPEHFMVHELSVSGNLEEAARHLFSVMRKADQSNSRTILALEFPDTGLGKAINDRLQRANFRFSH